MAGERQTGTDAETIRAEVAAEFRAWLYDCGVKGRDLHLSMTSVARLLVIFDDEFGCDAENGETG